MYSFRSNIHVTVGIILILAPSLLFVCLFIYDKDSAETVAMPVGSLLALGLFILDKRAK